MILDLLSVVRTDHNRIDKEVQLDMDMINIGYGDCPIVEKKPFILSINHVKSGQILLKGNTSITVEIPCDRCVKDVRMDIDLTIDNEFSLSEVASNDDDTLEEKNYIDGYNLDVDKVLYYEILLGWPMKILCESDCKGACNVCGQNLNKGACNCEDTSLDPRMSAIQDIFKSNKEV